MKTPLRARHARCKPRCRRYAMNKRKPEGQSLASCASSSATRLKSRRLPARVSKSATRAPSSSCWSRLLTHEVEAWQKSYRSGPLTGDESHICKLGACLLSTNVPSDPTVTLSTPSCHRTTMRARRLAGRIQNCGAFFFTEYSTSIASSGSSSAMSS